MPEYTPVYVVTGFLDSGKTSLLNQLLSRRLESGHSLCCIQFEQGEQALEQDLIDRGNLDLLHFPVRKLQSGAGMQQVSKQIYDYLLRNDPEELWIEWNGTLPISVLQTLFATVYKGNIIKNLIMDCQSYTKYRPNETMGGIFVSWRRKEELPTGA